MNLENKRQLATILLAVGLGLAAAMLMGKVVRDQVEHQTKVIAQDYQKSSAALVKEIDAAKRMLDKMARDQAALEKKVAQQAAARPQAVPRAGKPPAQAMAFSLRTPPGKRALTIMIDSLSAVGGLVNPGDFVDIIAQLDLPEVSGAKKEKITTVLFQNIQVLAVGTNFSAVGDMPLYEAQQKSKVLNVTLAVSPEEAGLLTFAQSNGKLQLSLRSAAETEDTILQQVASWDTLADFVLEHQGTELRIPQPKSTIAPGKTEEVEEEEVKPFIQIFRGGREL